MVGLYLIGGRPRKGFSENIKPTFAPVGRVCRSAAGRTHARHWCSAGCVVRRRQNACPPLVLAEHISIDPNVCFGRPVIRGTRIWVALIVDNLAKGPSDEELPHASHRARPLPWYTDRALAARPVFRHFQCRNRTRGLIVMTREQLAEHISIDPNVCFGRPVIRGTRIWVALIVDNLAEGLSEEELLRAYPQLTRDDIRAALAFAAEMTRERVLPITVGAGP